jgi:hypothetical protein
MVRSERAAADALYPHTPWCNIHLTAFVFHTRKQMVVSAPFRRTTL